MISKLRLVFTITMVFLSFYGSAQNTYWLQETSQKEMDLDFSARFNVKKGMVFSFEESLFKKNLKTVSSAKKNSKVVSFPDELGKMIPFQVTEASVLSPKLSAKYPQIKSYVGYALDGTKNKVRFSVSQNGMQSMMMNPEKEGSVFMQKNADGKYVVYQRDPDDVVAMDLFCSTKMTGVEHSTAKTNKQPVTGQVLRKFRLAVSASGEYTEFHGGTVADALAAINATVTRVTEVYETDLGISFELIDNTDSVIFTNAATDPYTGGLSSKVQNTLTDRIGEANYDLGILFHQIQNGVDGNSGTIGAVCKDNRKGSAYAATPNPTGDIFDLDLVSHEMGHQFGAYHTWSHELTGEPETQVEPGSGTTIMGYAGITGVNDVASNGDDYFHYISIVQIAEFLTTVSCAEEISLTNNPPVVTPTGSFTIPKSTAFVLTGNAVDPDTDDVLTYAWEQIDEGVVTQLTFGPKSRNGSNFRSQKPSTAPERYFPKLSRVLDGTLTQTNPDINTAWETVSDVEREMNFALTVRDNAPGGGQVASDLVNVFVADSSGPFVVTSQTDDVVMNSGTVETITWDVANTDQAPVNAETVDILLSVDGGMTFPIILADDVINDGTHDVIVPGNGTVEARIMVKASDNIFFAVNSSDFSIDTSEIVLRFDNVAFEVCQPDTLVAPFVYETYLGFNEEVTFSVDEQPVGLDISFSPVTAIDTDTPVEITFSNTENLAVGSYPISVLASTSGTTKEVTIDLHVRNTDFTDIALVAPEDGLLDASTSIMLEWEADFLATSYDIQIASDLEFSDIIDSANVNSNTYVPLNLENELTYFWRIKPKNGCDEGSFGTPFSFTTIQFNCIDKSAIGLPAVISSSGTPTITSKIAFFEDLPVADINVAVALDHSFLEDLRVSLTSPAGTTMVLFSNACGGLRNVNAVFDDSATDFECGGNPAISGTVRPSESLDAFKGESMFGVWTLTILDNSPSDGGSLKNFSITMCTEGQFRPDADNDGVFDDGPDLCLDTPLGTPVDTSGCPLLLFPTDNFEVAVQSEGCRSSNDGMIKIDADLALEYTITIMGNDTDLTDTFTSTYSINGLTAGTYAVCINGTGGTLDYEEHCFEVVVTEPEALGVSSKVSLESRIVELELTGSSLYNIELNGILTQTEASKISLDLKDGGNTLKVSTNLSCQGIYEEQFFLPNGPVVYPNPFNGVVKVSFGEHVEIVKIDIFAADGRFVQSNRYRVNGSELELDLSVLSVGLYYLKVDSEKVKGTSKIIKR